MTDAVKGITCFVITVISVCLLLCSCQLSDSEEDWGSFTAEKTCSYDNKYYAVQDVVDVDGIDTVRVTVYTEDGTVVYAFNTERASDFFGICWEKDTYNIWIQSADTGVACYSFKEGKWTEDPDAVRPEYIISKYDGMN